MCADLNLHLQVHDLIKLKASAFFVCACMSPLGKPAEHDEAMDAIPQQADHRCHQDANQTTSHCTGKRNGEDHNIQDL